MSREEIIDEIHSIKWRDYEAVHGNTEPMTCTQLLELFSEHQETAIEKPYSSNLSLEEASRPLQQGSRS